MRVSYICVRSAANIRSPVTNGEKPNSKYQIPFFRCQLKGFRVDGQLLKPVFDLDIDRDRQRMVCQSIVELLFAVVISS